MDPAKEDMPKSTEVTNLGNKPQEVGAKSSPLDVLKKWKIACKTSSAPDDPALDQTIDLLRPGGTYMKVTIKQASQLFFNR